MRRWVIGFAILGASLLAVLVILRVSWTTYRQRPGTRYSAELVLKEQLYEMRKAIDGFVEDHKGYYPNDLDELVPRYLRMIPVDPITGSARTWKVVRDHDSVVDVRSGSLERGGDGMSYAEW